MTRTGAGEPACWPRSLIACTTTRLRREDADVAGVGGQRLKVLDVVGQDRSAGLCHRYHHGVDGRALTARARREPARRASFSSGASTTLHLFKKRLTTASVR